jgi:hypothetical protein
VDGHMPTLLDLSFKELCNDIRSGSFFLRFYEIISQNHDQDKMFEIDQLNDYPSVETVRDVSIKIFSWVVVKIVYEGYGLNDALEVVDCFKSGFRLASVILLFPQQEVLYNHCERIKNDLIEIHNEREFFYWEKSALKLQVLHDILRDRNLIKENNRFIESFKKENVPKNLRTRWTGNGTDLVFLTYFLFKNLFGDSFYKRTYHLFYIKEVNYSIDFLRQTYHHIKGEFLNTKTFTSQRKELIEIIDRMNH